MARRIVCCGIIVLSFGLSPAAWPSARSQFDLQGFCEWLVAHVSQLASREQHFEHPPPRPQEPEAWRLVDYDRFTTQEDIDASWLRNTAKLYELEGTDWSLGDARIACTLLRRGGANGLHIQRVMRVWISGKWPNSQNENARSLIRQGIEGRYGPSLACGLIGMLKSRDAHGEYTHDRLPSVTADETRDALAVSRSHTVDSLLESLCIEFPEWDNELGPEHIQRLRDQLQRTIDTALRAETALTPNSSPETL